MITFLKQGDVIGKNKLDDILVEATFRSDIYIFM